MIKVDVDSKVKASEDERPDKGSPAIEHLKFPFNLKKDQEEAVEAWIRNDFRGSIVYSTGTGKTEIAFECARRAAIAKAGIVSDIGTNTSFKHNVGDDDPDRNKLVGTDSITSTTTSTRTTSAIDAPEKRPGSASSSRSIRARGLHRRHGRRTEPPCRSRAASSTSSPVGSSACRLSQGRARARP